LPAGIVDGRVGRFLMISIGRIVTLAVLFSTVCLAGCGPVQWEGNFEAGLSRAASEGRPAVVMFSSAFSPDCGEMDKDVFSDPEVEKVLDVYVPIRLEFVLHAKLAKELNVQTVPSFVVFRPDRSVAGVREGKMDVRSFTMFLIKSRYY
jgi:hypothetical protein